MDPGGGIWHERVQGCPSGWSREWHTVRSLSSGFPPSCRLPRARPPCTLNAEPRRKMRVLRVDGLQLRRQKRGPVTNGGLGLVDRTEAREPQETGRNRETRIKTVGGGRDLKGRTEERGEQRGSSVTHLTIQHTGVVLRTDPTWVQEGYGERKPQQESEGDRRARRSMHGEKLMKRGCFRDSPDDTPQEAGAVNGADVGAVQKGEGKRFKGDKRGGKSGKKRVGRGRSENRKASDKFLNKAKVAATADGAPDFACTENDRDWTKGRDDGRRGAKKQPRLRERGTGKLGGGHEVGWSGDIDGAARAEVERLAKQKRLRRFADEAESERRRKDESDRDRDARRTLQRRAKRFEAAARQKTVKVKMWHGGCVGCVDEEVVTVEEVLSISKIVCLTVELVDGYA